jgi:hypothetical protein
MMERVVGTTRRVVGRFVGVGLERSFSIEASISCKGEVCFNDCFFMFSAKISKALRFQCSMSKPRVFLSITCRYFHPEKFNLESFFIPAYR